MLIKGTHTGKIRGTKRGDVIEFSPEEKFAPAVQRALQGLMTNDLVLVYSKVELEQKEWASLGKPLLDKFQNNSYKGRGTVWFREKHPKTDRVFPIKPYDFSIEFKDVLTQGIPSIEVTAFNYKAK